MKMSSRGLCCDRCFTMIAQESTTAARLWLDLCDIHRESNMFGLRTPDTAALRTLELMRFITTTETPNMIMVKVHGHRWESTGSLYCGGKCHG